MAMMMRTKAVATTGRAAPRRAAVVAQAAKGEIGLAAATFAAAALLASPAQAGVVLQQPELKKVFQSDAAPAAPVERPFRQPGAASAPAVKAEAKKEEKKKDEEPLSDGGIDPRAVALPGAIVGIAGLAFAASKVDDGFTEWINDSGALVRNSGNFAGFEEDIKGDNYLQPAGTKKVGTKKTKK